MSEYIISPGSNIQVIYQNGKFDIIFDSDTAEKIVRCKDCTKCETEKTKSWILYHCTEFECTWCGGFVYVDEYSFCSWGEKKGE